MLERFCHRIHFPLEAIEYLLNTEPNVDFGTLKQIGRQYLSGDQLYMSALESEANRINIPVETMSLFLLIYLFQDHLYFRYAEAGLPELLFWETAEDLTYKLRECYNEHGIWGNLALHWYPKFFSLNCFKLGRLQYEISIWNEKTEIPPIHTGDRVFKIHIPSCGPLTEESVEESFATAKKFFKDHGYLTTEYFPVMCASWLLYPPYHDLFPNGSNLQKFQDIFTIVSTTCRNKDFHRVFNMPYTDDFDILPENTSLQRNFKNYLKNGGKLGLGRGIAFR